jgi:hypothetical protein
VVAVVGGGASAASAIRELSVANFVPPCYFSLFMKEAVELPDPGNTHCCGAYQNITRYGDFSQNCAKPKLGLYD